MNNRYCRSLLIFTVVFSLRSFGEKSTGEFILIGTPGSCALYDQYEQPLSEARKKKLPSNAPFEIINNDQLMGDQITRAMRLSLHGTTYYLLLDDRGNMSGVPRSASAVRYAGCTPHYDTLIVTASSLALMRQPSGGGKIATLHKGDAVLRIFSRRGSNYLLRLDSSPVYGWTGTTRQRLRPKETRRAATDGSDDPYTLLHLRIMKRLKDANERYDSLFAYFNMKTGQSKTVPQWEYRAGNEHVYSLKGSAEVIRTFENSTRHIVRDIEQLLLGKPFQVSYRQGVITIGSR